VNPDGTGAGVTEDSTFYTQVNMTRTIEQMAAGVVTGFSSSTSPGLIAECQWGLTHEDLRARLSRIAL
jgi:hypothetical protein